MRIVMNALIVSVALHVPAAAGEVTIEVEGGILLPGYIDVRIPGDTGTGFSMTDDLSADSTGYWRLRAGVRFGERHALVFEAAPVTVESSGTIGRDVDFAGKAFLVGTPLRGTYQFNTYRLAYRYDLRTDTDSRSALGGTLLVRDAVIRLVDSGGQAAEDSNVGLVPLVGFEYERRIRGDWWFALDGNALAAPQGRAEDVFVGARWSPEPSKRLSFGYRIIEGGADNDEVYTFALFSHIAVAAAFRF